jgi:hypothetical protein
LDYSYGTLLKRLKLHTLVARGHCLDVLFLIHVFKGFKYCSTTLQKVGLRDRHRNFRDFSLFNVDAKSHNSVSATCTLAANAIGSGFGTFTERSISITYLLAFDTFNR